jgi:hypothetical protein
MPRFLTPYENTPNAALCNAQGQITRRQFEMLIEPETPMSRAQLRRLRQVILILGVSFVAWWGLYEFSRQGWDIPWNWVVLMGCALLLVCVIIIISAAARLLWGMLAITPTSDEVGEALRKRIREGNLGIQSVEGRPRFRHLNAGRHGVLCSLLIGKRDFPISQALWETLHERPQAGKWVAFYLREPNALLSVSRLDELEQGRVTLPDGEGVVSGKTIARRADL